MNEHASPDDDNILIYYIRGGRGLLGKQVQNRPVWEGLLD